MSITVEEASTPVDPETGAAPRAPGHEVEAGRRGTTTVATGAVERVVGWVAANTPGVSAASLTGVRGWLGADRPDVADAHVETGEHGLHISLDVAVTYPEPVAEVADRIRERVINALSDQLAMTTERVDVTVAELRRPTRDRVPVQGRVR